MEMGLIQVCDLPQVVAWLLTVRDEPNYLFPSVLHPFWQPPWSMAAWIPGQGLGTASTPRASSLCGQEGQKQSPGCSWEKPGPGCSHICSQYLAFLETPCAGKMGNTGAEGAPEPAAGRHSPNLTAAPGVVFGFLKGFAISNRFILGFTFLPLQKPCLDNA